MRKVFSPVFLRCNMNNKRTGRNKKIYMGQLNRHVYGPSVIAYKLDGRIFEGFSAKTLPSVGDDREGGPE
jgi:hypothetical protein